MNDFEQCLKLTFGKFSVARKPIINGGAIRPGGLLFKYHSCLMSSGNIFERKIFRSRSNLCMRDIFFR